MEANEKEVSARRLFDGYKLEAKYDLESLEAIAETLVNWYKEKEQEGIVISRKDAQLRHFMILLSGFQAMESGHRCDELKAESDPEFIDAVKEMLEMEGGVRSRQDLLEMSSYLIEKGYQSRYQIGLTSSSSAEFAKNLGVDDIAYAERIWNFIQRFKDKLPSDYVQGWDYGWAASLIRWGYTAGLISAEESWNWLEKIAEKMIEKFSSWKDYGLSYLFGCLFKACGYRSDEELLILFKEKASILAALLNQKEDEPGLWCVPWIAGLSD